MICILDGFTGYVSLFSKCREIYFLKEQTEIEEEIKRGNQNGR